MKFLPASRRNSFVACEPCPDPQSTSMYNILRNVLGPRWTYSIYDTTLARFQKTCVFFFEEMSASSISGGSIRRLTKRWPAMCRLIRAWRCCTTSNVSTIKTWSTFALSWISYLTYTMCISIYVCILLITVYSIIFCISFQYHYKPLVLNGVLVVWFLGVVFLKGVSRYQYRISQSNSNPKALHQAFFLDLTHVIAPGRYDDFSIIMDLLTPC